MTVIPPEVEAACEQAGEAIPPKLCLLRSEWALAGWLVSQAICQKRSTERWNIETHTQKDTTKRSKLSKQRQVAYELTITAGALRFSPYERGFGWSLKKTWISWLWMNANSPSRSGRSVLFSL